MTCQIMMQEVSHPRTRASMAALWVSEQAIINKKILCLSLTTHQDCNWVLGNLTASWTLFGCAYLTTSWSWVSAVISLLSAPLS